MSKERTPGPWDFDAEYVRHTEIPFREDLGVITIMGKNDGDVAYVANWIEREEQEANAAFIVRACNSHDALAEALKACAESLTFAREKLGMCGEGDGKDHKADAPDDIGSALALAMARAALQAAGIE